MYKSFFDKLRNGFDKKKYNKSYYLKKRASILQQQREYQLKNRAEVLACKRIKYIMNRKSTKKYRPQKARKEREKRIAFLEAKIKEIQQQLVEHQKEYNVWLQKQSELLDEMSKNGEENK
jgi:uncharacterized coiled-coil protein SlyX